MDKYYRKDNFITFEQYVENVYMSLVTKYKIQNAGIKRLKVCKFTNDSPLKFKSGVCVFGQIPYWDTNSLIPLSQEEIFRENSTIKIAKETSVITVGEKMNPLKNLKSFYSRKNITFDFQQKSDKITVILMCSYLDKSFQEKIEFMHNLFFVKHAENWNDKIVNYIGILLGNNYTNLRECNISDTCNYYLMKTKNFIYNKMFYKLDKLSELSALVIVSEDNKIIYCDKFDTETAENIIHQALKHEKIIVNPYQENIMAKNQSSIYEIYKCWQNNEKQIKSNSTIIRNALRISQQYNPELQIFENPISSYFLKLEFKNNKETSLKLRESIVKMFENHCSLNLEIINKHLPKNPHDSLSRHNNCSQCKKIILSESQFICISCIPPVAFCFDCGIQNAEKINSGHFHNLVFIQQSTKVDEIDKIALDLNKTIDRTHKTKKCSGCKITPIIGTRWKCMNCENVNLCENCFKIIEQNDTKNILFEYIQRKLLKNRHLHNSHTYIKIEYASSFKENT